MKKHIGNLIIEKNDKRDFSKLKEVTGDLSIYSNADLKALTTVGGDLYIYSNADLKAPLLTTVGGDLSIYSNADLKALTTVGGDLCIYSNADLKALTTVGGYLYIYSNADLKALTTVGGDLYIYSNADLKIPFLKNKNWKSIDNKLFIIESEKSTKGIKIYTGYNLKGLKKNKPKKENCYVAEKDNFSAHGETPKAAIKDCLFKIIAEKIKNEPILKTTIIDINYYHTVTGSCVLGIKSWMEQYDIPEGLTAEKLLPILESKHAYGLEKFKSLITF